MILYSKESFHADDRCCLGGDSAIVRVVPLQEYARSQWILSENQSKEFYLNYHQHNLTNRVGLYIYEDFKIQAGRGALYNRAMAYAMHLDLIDHAHDT